MNLYVGNIKHGMGEDALKAVFQAFGEVTTVKLVTDKFTGQARGFGFVEMPNTNEAQAAIEALNGKEVEGRRLVVNEARQREERPARRSFGEGQGGSGSRGGFGGNRGGGSGFGGNRSSNGGGFGSRGGF